MYLLYWTVLNSVSYGNYAGMLLVGKSNRHNNCRHYYRYSYRRNLNNLTEIQCIVRLYEYRYCTLEHLLISVIFIFFLRGERILWKTFFNFFNKGQLAITNKLYSGVLLTSTPSS